MPSVPDGYEIVRALPRELTELPVIETEAATIFPPEHVAPESREDGLPLAFYEEVAAAGRLWVARSLEPPAPIGFAAITLLDESAHLHEMDVLPAHGRRGLGRALVLHAAQWARAAGFADITLTTFRHLPWNAPFYSSIGFSEIPDRELGPELQAVITDEAHRGLEPRQRVATRLDLRAT
jgi:GNAT superfamily N-acetyltransferase